MVELMMDMLDFCCPVVAWMWGVASRLPRGRNGSIVFHVAYLAEDFSSTWHSKKWREGEK